MKAIKGRNLKIGKLYCSCRDLEDPRATILMYIAKQGRINRFNLVSKNNRKYALWFGFMEILDDIEFYELPEETTIGQIYKLNQNQK